MTLTAERSYVRVLIGSGRHVVLRILNPPSGFVTEGMAHGSSPKSGQQWTTDPERKSSALLKSMKSKLARDAESEDFVIGYVVPEVERRLRSPALVNREAEQFARVLGRTSGAYRTKLEATHRRWEEDGTRNVVAVVDGAGAAGRGAVGAAAGRTAAGRGGAKGKEEGGKSSLESLFEQDAEFFHVLLPVMRTTWEFLLLHFPDAPLTDGGKSRGDFLRDCVEVVEVIDVESRKNAVGKKIAVGLKGGDAAERATRALNNIPPSR